MWKFKALLIVLLLTSAACGNMADQPKCTALGQIPGFKNGACAQPLPQGVVARDTIVDNPALTTGKVGGQFVTTLPIPVSQDVLERGRDRFQIYCRPCHGAAGYGDGVVTNYGFPAPPSLHSDALRQFPPGAMFGIITSGAGSMPSYAQQIDVNDRWAIIAYVEALQLSQHATVDTLPQADKEQLPQ